MSESDLMRAWSEDGLLHTDGVPWWEAPLPRRWHRCRRQTLGFVSGAGYIDRCACGAIRRDAHQWSEKNSRRRSR